MLLSTSNFNPPPYSWRTYSMHAFTAKTFETLCPRRDGWCATLLIGVLVIAAACGGSEPSGEVSSSQDESAGAAASAEVDSNAQLGTGFIMMSEISQLQLTAGTFLEEGDCAARVSALGDPAQYEGCVEVPSAAICLEVAEGLRDSDRWWECFMRQDGCEEAIAAHEVIIEVGGYVRELLQGCAETEMASVFASMM
jgi:hypothetical protein